MFVYAIVVCYRQWLGDFLRHPANDTSLVSNRIIRRGNKTLSINSERKFVCLFLTRNVYCQTASVSFVVGGLKLLKQTMKIYRLSVNSLNSLMHTRTRGSSSIRITRKARFSFSCLNETVCCRVKLSFYFVQLLSWE